MDVEMRSQLLGGAAFLVAGIVVLVIGAPGLLGLLLIVAGMVLLGLVLGGYPSLAALLGDRGTRRRRRRR